MTFLIGLSALSGTEIQVAMYASLGRLQSLRRSAAQQGWRHTAAAEADWQGQSQGADLYWEESGRTGSLPHRQEACRLEQTVCQHHPANIAYYDTLLQLAN